MKRQYLEAKWFYNAIIASQDIFVLREDYKTEHVTVKDIRNKLIHKLARTFQVICYQDDAIKGWQKYGRKIMNNGIGGVTSALKLKADSSTSAEILPINPDELRMSFPLQSTVKRENLSLHMLRFIDRQRPQRSKKYREGRVDE